jgi:hypothetical protein
MENKIKEITSYLRSAVAAQVNRTIDFKDGKYCCFSFDELINGKINEQIFKEFLSLEKYQNNKESISVIIVAKTIRTIYDVQVKKNSNIEDLTGIYFIPAYLKSDGTLNYSENKLPWIPREYLAPMIEPLISLGTYKDFDQYMSNSIGRIYKIKTWKDYISFAADLYEYVTKEKFDEIKLDETELEGNIYILKDETVNATKSLLELYDSLLNEYEGSKLYENFIELKNKEISPLIPNTITKMYEHCGQMGGEFPLSDSQREGLNHFNQMAYGEILAINGPPGTGKTTLLQTIVANMYVTRALKKEKPPIIVATSTNNQAVTNIIESFGKIKQIGYDNLEQRWVEGVRSFALYFASSRTENSANDKGYHYTVLRGDNFIAEVESKDNVEKSKIKMLESCSSFFKEKFTTLKQCEEKIHTTLCKTNDIRRNLLNIFQRFDALGVTNKSIEEFLACLESDLKDLENKVIQYQKRVEAWNKHFNNIPMVYKLLKFLKSFKRKIEIRNRLFLEVEENFLNEYMSLDDIMEKYSFIIRDTKIKAEEVKRKYNDVNKLKLEYDENLVFLDFMNIDIFKSEKNKEIKGINKINEILDKTLRYIQFWLAVHYYECRWAGGEDSLSEKQRKSNLTDVLPKLHNRLSMITPCYVMTFYQIPKNFTTYDGRNHFMYNYIDLLIVDEAGQVSPEIAAGCFSLAKKALVVGDINQIEPVWSVSEALDKALAIENKAIADKDEFKKLKELGINSSSSSVMAAAAKSCRYSKFDDRGLFLSEHRRCYNEIIAYCNKLVYKGHLEPIRGKGVEDSKYLLKDIPHMGHRQVTSEYSARRGSSRYNRNEAKAISEWIYDNFEKIAAAYPNDNTNNLLGIITPFKEQVRCINNELKKVLNTEVYKYISVGTVHTFQGAERNLIILSTVYGAMDGCYFLDVSNSMLNVAVSRARDSFLIFGDINCLSNSTENASGLLKKFIEKSKV